MPLSCILAPFVDHPLTSLAWSAGGVGGAELECARLVDLELSAARDAEVELVRKLYSAGDEAGIITLFAKKDELLAKKDAEKNLITKEKNRIAEEKNLIAKEKNRIAEERDIAKAKLDPVDRLIDTLHLALMRLKAKAPPALKPLFSFPVALGLLLIVGYLLFRMY
eukprot:tig00000955_g5773.t1